MFTRPRITSTTLTSSARARSPTTIVLGSVTTVPVSATATGAAGSGGGGGACGRCGRRPLGRGPRCGGIRLGLALGTSSPFLRGHGQLFSEFGGRGFVYRYFERSRECALGQAALEAAWVRIEVGPPAGRLAAEVDRELPQRGAYDAHELPFRACRPAGHAGPLGRSRGSPPPTPGARGPSPLAPYGAPPFSSCLPGAHGPLHPGPPRPPGQIQPRPLRRGRDGSRIPPPPAPARRRRRARVRVRARPRRAPPIRFGCRSASR